MGELNAQRLARRRRLRNALNRAMLILCGCLTLVAVIPLVWIVGYVLVEGGSFLNVTFFTSLPTPVGVPGGGIVNALLGSLVVVGIACAIAIPVSILGALYTSEHPSGSVATVVRFATDVLSGVPSVVIGIFAYTIVVVPQSHFSALAGGVALSIIMTPIVFRTTEEMVRLVPNQLREAALALGAPRWRATAQVVLPAALNGVVTGVMLGIARITGEAAPMIFTAFGNPFLAADPRQPMATLPHTVYVYAISPYPDWRGKAWATALVLILLVLGLNVAARAFMAWRMRRFGGR